MASCCGSKPRYPRTVVKPPRYTRSDRGHEPVTSASSIGARVAQHDVDSRPRRLDSFGRERKGISTPDRVFFETGGRDDDDRAVDRYRGAGFGRLQPMDAVRVVPAVHGRRRARRAEADTQLHWVADIGGSTREWDAEIAEQHPDHRVAWKALDQDGPDGVVTFHKLDDARTRVMVQMDYEPEGMKKSHRQHGRARRPSGQEGPRGVQGPHRGHRARDRRSRGNVEN